MSKTVMFARMKIAIPAVLMLSAASACADTLTIKGLLYPDVKIIEVSEGTVSFRVRGGGINKPLSEVTAVEISNQASFNKAEALMKDGKAAEAVEAYDAAAKNISEPWLKRLLEYRRLRALDRAGQIDRAAEEWLVAVEAGEATEEVLSLCPSRPAPRSDKQNDRAINLLEERLKHVKDKAYRAAIKRLLLTLYQQQGYDDRAAALAQELVSGLKPPAGDVGGRTVAAPVRGTGLAAQIQAAGILLKQGRPAKALKAIRANLKRYPPSELPGALLVAGKAQMALSEKASTEPARRKLLLSAGLNFMRIATFFANVDEAPEALYQAGRVNAGLGNPRAAKNAYESVINQYGSSKAAEKAKAALKALER